MKKQRGSQMKRQWNILVACQALEGRSVEELSQLLKASRRTIYRDLLILKDAAANISTFVDQSKPVEQLKYRSHQPFFVQVFHAEMANNDNSYSLLSVQPSK